MRACLAMGMALWAGVAQAQWVYQAGPAPGDHTAQVCTRGSGAQAGVRLCFGLSCQAGGAMGFDLRAGGSADMLARAEVQVQVFTGAYALAPMAFHSDGLGHFVAPLTQAHLSALQHLKAGRQMQVIYWEGAGRPPVSWSMSLTGSRDALTALESACSLPDTRPSAVVEHSADPGVEVLDAFQAACDALGGTVTVGPGYSRLIDLDGVAPPDLVLRHGALECSAMPDLVCGPEGCLTSVWQAGPDGYTRVFLNAVQDVAALRPGALRLSLRGGLCGGGAGACQQVWSLRDGALAPEE